MNSAEFRGARGSNAGDDFHELWALRKALELLDPKTKLRKMTVEGIGSEDESGEAPHTWDGVDCALYYGSHEDGPLEGIKIVQVKYSSAAPDTPWTVARLTGSKKKTGGGSIIRKMATAHSALSKKHPELASAGKIAVRLVSNQPVAKEVLDAQSGTFQQTSTTQKESDSPTTAKRNALCRASGLQKFEFEAFSAALDFSQCGHGSRFALEEKTIAAIAQWTGGNAGGLYERLRTFIRRRTLPGEGGEAITVHSLLAQFDCSDRGALLPCPSFIQPVERPISRRASQDIVDLMVNGDDRICLHGAGGCGKTTLLHEILSLLPDHSRMIVFDCYGGGTYLDSDAYRHREQDAFLQLSNQLASSLRIPWLLSRSQGLDYPREFKRRLEFAGEALAAEWPEALLVMAIDAVDNAETAARTCVPRETSFLHKFLNIGHLPQNVRLLVSARSGRLREFRLPRSFRKVEIGGFSELETASFVRGMWPRTGEDTLHELHTLSNGNPRVLRYAMDFAKGDLNGARDYLLPSGESINSIFRTQWEYASAKCGQDVDLEVFSSALVSLPRPIPVNALSSVTELDEGHLRDICSDLAPGVHFRDGMVSFADEDFEYFLREQANAQLKTVRARIANYCLDRHKRDPYAAEHVARALLHAERRQDLLSLIRDHPTPNCIADPVIRRHVQLRRLRAALKVCNDVEDRVEALDVVRLGADALKTNVLLRRTLAENPDLAALFAQETSIRAILCDPEQVEHQGPLLLALMAIDARKNRAMAVRRGHQQFQAWMERRKEALERQEREAHDPPRSLPIPRPKDWAVTAVEVGAQMEAILRIKGPQEALDSLWRWYPRVLAIQAAIRLATRLVAGGENELVRRWSAEATAPGPWRLFLLIPLALSGADVDTSCLVRDLRSLHRRQLIQPGWLHKSFEFRAESPVFTYLNSVLTACEVLALGGTEARHSWTFWTASLRRNLAA